MTARLNPAMAARIVAMAFVMLAIAATAFQIKQQDNEPAAATSLMSAVDDADPIRAELRHCQLLGEAGAHDAGCLRAWAENRRRFLRLGAQPGEPSPVGMFPNAPPASNGAPGDASADQPKSNKE